MTPTQSRIVDLVRSYVGCTLDDSTPDAKLRRAALAQLVARQVDDPEHMVLVKTNCGTVSLGFLYVLGVDHPLVRARYVNGKAPEWLLRIGRDLHVLHRFDGDSTTLRAGQLLYYVLASGSDHFEWLLSDPDADGEADHAGGGRPDNAITEGHSDVRRSAGRPLVFVLDVPSLLDGALPDSAA